MSTSSTPQVTPNATPTPAPSPRFAVEGGFVTFNGRKFEVMQGDQVVSNQEALLKIVKIMNDHADLEEIKKCIPSDKDGDEAKKQALTGVKITIDKEKISILGDKKKEDQSIEKINEAVTKSLEQVAETHGTRPKSLESRFTKLTNRISKHAQLVGQLKAEFHAKNYTKQAVCEAVGRILDEPPRRMDQVGSWQENTLAHCLQMYGNESLRSALIEARNTYIAIPSQDNESHGKCEKMLRRFIMENMIRSPKESAIRVAKDPKTSPPLRAIQKFCKEVEVDTNGNVIKGENQAISSTEDKNLNPREKANSNLGAVVVAGSDNSTECVVTRSGRSNSPRRLREAIIHAALEQLETGKLDRFVEKDDGSLEFTHHITSYLDPSDIKSLTALPKKVKNFIKGEEKNTEDEKEYLTGILQARDEFKEETITVKKDDKEYKITLKKPVVSNELFSSTVRGVHLFNTRLAEMGNAARDRIDFVSNIELFNRAFPEPIAADSLLAQCGNALSFVVLPNGAIDTSQVSQADLVSSRSDTSKAFSSKEMAEYKEALARLYLEKYTDENCSDDVKNKIRALFALTFRKDIIDFAPGFDSGNEDISYSKPPALHEELHAADLEIFRNFLDRELKISSGKQCKSGTDRTGVGVALAVAQHEYKKIYEEDFFPPGVSDEKDVAKKKEEDLKRVQFKILFRKALIDLGLSMTVETKGYSGLKLIDGLIIFGGKGNPVPLKYLLNQDDIDVINKNDVLRTKYEANFGSGLERDATLSEEDLRARGLKQYQGKFTDSYLYGSKSSGVKDKDRIPNTEFKDQALLSVCKELEKIFTDGGKSWAWSADLENKTRTLFDDNLNLKVHINQLGFSRDSSQREKQRNAIKAKIDGLSRRVQDDETAKMQIYILKQILWLEEQRMRSKNLINNLPADPEGDEGQELSSVVLNQVE